MELLKQRIRKDGKVLNNNVLKVDNFINHQLEPQLMMAIGVEFAHRFAYARATKVLTIEASGIAPAIMTGYCLGIPVVFAKKSIPSTMKAPLVSKVHSFTKDIDYTVAVESELIKPTDKILCIDDFLAYGSAANSLHDIIKQAGAGLAGMGFVIEKSFQNGGQLLREQGIHVESLAIIKEISDNGIIFNE